MKFKKVGKSVMFTHEGEFTDFKNTDGEVIGTSKVTQDVRFDDLDKAIKMLMDNKDHVNGELKKYQEQLDKMTIDTTVFKEFGKFCERNKDKVPLHKFKKLESVASLIEAENTANKMIVYLNTELEKIQYQIDEFNKVLNK